MSAVQNGSLIENIHLCSACLSSMRAACTSFIAGMTRSYRINIEVIHGDDCSGSLGALVISRPKVGAVGSTVGAVHDQGFTVGAIHDQGSTVGAVHDRGFTVGAVHDRGFTVGAVHDRDCTFSQHQGAAGRLGL